MITTMDVEQLERFYSKMDQKKGGGSSSPPPAPNPYAVAAAQGAANKEAAISEGELSMVNQQTPYGNLEFSQRGTTASGTPQYSATQTLDPSGQRQLDYTNQAGEQYGQIANDQLGQISDKLSQPVNFGDLGQAPLADLSTLGNAPTANFDSLGAGPTANYDSLGAAPTADLRTLGDAPTANYDSLGAAPVANEQTRQAVRQGIQDREKPFQDRRLQELQSRLDTQGITQGSKAYSDAMFDNNRRLNDFNLGADNQALGQMSQLYGLEADQRNRATGEIGSLYGLEADQRGRATNELGQQFAIDNQARDRATNEIGQLYGLQADQRGRETNEIGQQFDFANQARDRSQRDIESQYGLDANARDRGVNELTQQRSIPLNELAAMLSGTSVQGPQFVGTPSPSIQAGDLQGATYANYQGAQNAYNTQQQAKASAKGGIGSTIGSLAMAGGTAY